MLFQIKCASCGTVYDLTGESLDQCLQCGKCHKFLFASTKDKIKSGETRVAEPLPDSVIKVSCPKCSAHYELTSEFIGEQVQCSECSKNFIVKKPQKLSQNGPRSTTILEKPVTEAPIDEEKLTDDRTIVLKRPTDGKPQGMIPDYNQNKQKPVQPQVNTPPQPQVNTPPQPPANIPEQFAVFCPRCNIKYEVTRALIGEQAECECGRLFIIEFPTPPEPKKIAPVTRQEKSLAALISELKPSPVQAKPIEEKPKPPSEAENFADDRTVKLKRQTNGRPQGMIPDYGLSMQKAAPVAPSQVNIPAQFAIFCPRCNIKYEVTRELIGEQAECECGQLFKIAAPTPQSNELNKSVPRPSAPPKPEPQFPTTVAEKPIPKEPEPPKVEEKFIDDRTVKLKRQANGKPQGMIPDYGLSQKASPVAPPQVNTPAQAQAQANIPAQFSVSCPQCGSQYDVTKELIGEQAECECSCIFKIAAPPPPAPEPSSPFKLTKKTAKASPQKSSGSGSAKPGKKPAKSAPPSVPWYMFWKKIFGKS